MEHSGLYYCLGQGIGQPVEIIFYVVVECKPLAAVQERNLLMLNQSVREIVWKTKRKLLVMKVDGNGALSRCLIGGRQSQLVV